MNEPVRILADWLQDATDGVNALLPSVPRSVGDPLPTLVTVYDETRDNRPARDRLPEKGHPGVVVSLRSGVMIPENVVTDDGDIRGELGVHYVAHDADAFEARRDGGYVLRAVVWSLRRLRLAAVEAPGRTTNQVILHDLGPVRIEPWYQTEGDLQQVGTVIVPFTGRDTFAL